MARPAMQNALDDLADFSIEPSAAAPVRLSFTG
jgi:hypothetical protein